MESSDRYDASFSSSNTWVSTVDIFQDIPTLIPPTNFDPVSDAAALYDAMVGLGTDENKIIDVLCYRSFEQRAEITDAYYTGYGVSIPLHA